MDNKSFSRYRSINSLVHKIDPITKLLGFLLFSVLIFLAKNMIVLLVVLDFALVISIFARVKLSTYLRLFLISMPFFIFLLLVYYLVTFKIENSLYISGQIFIRMYMFVLIASIYTSTTKEMDIANSMETIIYPLKFIKVPVYEISLMIMLAIRFIPLILLDLNKIFIAQTSRGINSINGNLKEKIISFKNALLPLFILAFKRADNISISMEMRGYKLGNKRTKYIKNKFSISDFFSILFLIGCLILVILFNLEIIPGASF